MNKITIINNYKKALNKLERLNYKQREEIYYYLDDIYCLFNIVILFIKFNLSFHKCYFYNYSITNYIFNYTYNNK